ncbi:hypothetical protein GQ600_13166 [Phytophthora cactorum]|nr:hypothetical protein GQ600_13166 [Phytophthora cactorum]
MVLCREQSVTIVNYLYGLPVYGNKRRRRRNKKQEKWRKDLRRYQLLLPSLEERATRLKSGRGGCTTCSRLRAFVSFEDEE